MPEPPTILDLDLLVEPTRYVTLGGERYALISPVSIGLLLSHRLRAYQDEMLRADEVIAGRETTEAEASELERRMREVIQLIVPELPSDVPLAYVQMTAVLAYFFESMGATVRELEHTCAGCGAVSMQVVPTVAMSVQTMAR